MTNTGTAPAPRVSFPASILDHVSLELAVIRPRPEFVVDGLEVRTTFADLGVVLSGLRAAFPAEFPEMLVRVV